MSEIWYRIAPRFMTAAIKENTFEKSTDKFLVMDGAQRTAKSSAYSQYFATWDEAHQALLQLAEQELTKARRALERAQGFHGNVKGMKRP